MSGSIMRSNNNGERGSPYRVSLRISMGGVCPCDVTNSVVAPLYRFDIMPMKSSGRPRKDSVMTS